ncbi:hypothetical protein ThidrDRAFT_4410 [Thiorhodococcus drewsii AZ1]|uniref:Uncharacterized protein n=1 Tax=Thiorhodococcus drewsii AZ1 TaxID=765913 RepID=G2E7Z6_9GAMM|nr:hypothetical protein ThidrDRAFT_4410 [Thiorhodococcus drewsii AZ1]
MSVQTGGEGIEPELFADRLAQNIDRLLALKIVEQLFVFLVVEDDPSLTVEQHHDHRCGIEHRLDAGLLLAQRPFELVHLGDVAMHAEEVFEVAVAVQHRRDGQLGQVVAALLGAVHQGAGPGLLMLDGAPQVLIDAVRGGVVGQNRLVLSPYLFAAVAGERLEGMVGVEDGRLGVGDRDGDGRLLNGLEEESRWQGIARVAPHQGQRLHHFRWCSDRRRGEKFAQRIDHGLLGGFRGLSNRHGFLLRSSADLTRTSSTK